MLRARPLRAASAALPVLPRSITPHHLSPISGNSHHIGENTHHLATPCPASARRAAPAVLLTAVFLALLALFSPTPAAAQAQGAACPVNGYTAAATPATGGQNLVCSSLAWAYVPYQFGASAGTCPGTSNVNLGMIQWTGSAFQGCTASGWGSLASGGTALSSITSATAVHSFDSTNFAQTWTWNSLTTQTAFTLSSSSLTNGAILSIQNTAASATSTGQVLSISDATTGSGYGVYSSMTGHGNSGYAGYFTNTGSTNTGYAGYFSNTDTGNDANYGIYASVASISSNAYAGYFNGNILVNGNDPDPTLFINPASNFNGYSTAESIIELYGVAGFGSNQWGEIAMSGGAPGPSLYSGPVMTVGTYGPYPLTFMTNNTNALFITSTGSVGVNSSSPAALFELANGDDSTGSGNRGQISFAYNTGGYRHFIQTRHVNGDNDGDAFVLWLNSSATSGGSSAPGTGNAKALDLGAATEKFYTNGNEAMRIDVNGDVDIGTTSAQTGAQLTVTNPTASGTTYGGYFSSATTGAGYGVYGTITGHGNTGYAGYFSNTDTSSNVNYALYATVSGASAWAGYFNGNVYVNGTITMSSDRSLKQDIETLDSDAALDQIAALRPVAFTWKKTGAPDMGLIAQEVDSVYPELVTHGAADETLALKYTSLIAPMIASIQELKKRNDKIEIENASLRRDFDAYREAHP